MTTTFVDPLGITSTVQAKTGIVKLDATNAQVAVLHDCGWMVAIFTPIEDNSNGTLPAGAAVGDICEVYVRESAFTGHVTMHAPSGESIASGGSGQVVVAVGRLFRKIDSTTWVTLGPSDGSA